MSLTAADDEAGGFIDEISEMLQNEAYFIGVEGEPDEYLRRLLKCSLESLLRGCNPIEVHRVHEYIAVARDHEGRITVCASSNNAARPRG